MKSDKAAKVYRLIKSVEEAPKWMIDNLHLKGGYRVGYTCIKSNMKSLFVKHNDLMNIWTHLLGTLFFLSFFIYLLVSSSYASSLYQELKVDIRCMHITERIQTSYSTNVEPLLRSLKENALQLEKMDWAEFKSQLIDMAKKAEQEYMEALNELTAKFQEQEVDFLRKFEIQYDSLVRNFGILKSNLATRISGLSKLSMDAVSDMMEHLDMSFNTEYFVEKLRNAMQMDLEVYPVAVFVICAAFCLGASAVYHTFYVMSPKIDKFLHRFDMAGINILIFGSVYAVLYYFLYCSPVTKFIYLSGCFIACMTVFLISMGNTIHKPENVKLKGLMFGGLGISNGIPMFHVLYLGLSAGHDNDHIPVNSVFFGIVLMGAMYLIGLCFYVFRIPERLYPKTFDIWLNSHTIWHLFVFAAAVVHLGNVVTLYRIRKSMPCSVWL